MITIPIDNTNKKPMYEQIYSYIKHEIQTGQLAFKTKLPSTRMLAANLNVCRNTVDIAYEQLLSEGYIESLPRKGYFVCNLSDLAAFSEPYKEKPVLKEKRQDPIHYDFSPFSVDMTHFPHSIWQQLSKNSLFNNNLFLLGEKQGDLSLRNSIASYLHGSRGVHCSPEQIVVGAGMDYLLFLLTLIFEKPLSVAMENPTYMRAYHIFQSAKYKIQGIPIEKDGINIPLLHDSRSDLVYVTPSHQYPMGVVMSISKRQELLLWAYEKENRYIIEDDHDSEFRYKGKPIPSLQGIDSKEKVIYIGTFSRAIAPAIRVGYMVLPKELLDVYHEKCSYLACTVSRIDQSIIHQFISDGYFEKHLNRMRKIYKAKHDICLQELKKFSGKIDVIGENAGLHLVLHLLKNHKFTSVEKSLEYENEKIKNAAEAGIKLYGLSEHFISLPEDYQPSILLGFANLTEEKLIEGINKINF